MYKYIWKKCELMLMELEEEIFVGDIRETGIITL